MARTPRSAGQQNTLGPVGMAVLPTDPVPLEQSGGGTWIGSQGVESTISTSKQYIWVWNAEINIAKPFNFPFNARLKEVYWRMWDHTPVSPLLVKRGNNYQTVATIQSGVPQKLDLQFGPEIMIFQTSNFIRLGFRWQIAAKWQIESPAAPSQIETVLSSIPDLEQPQAATPIPQIEQPLAATEPIAAKGSNRFSSWIRRRFR